MSAIVGWVDFGRAMARERSTLLTMTAAMACRGPDAEDTWIGEHAALGHRRLWVDGVGGPDQPLVGPGPRGPVGIFDGMLDNAADVRSDLAASGCRPSGEGDAALALAAYLMWGPGCAERLEGMYAFAVWEPAREELLLVRDRLGVSPLYWCRAGDGLLFASEPKALLANPLVEATVDGDGLREILTFAATPGRTAYRGIRKVRPGHVLRFTRDGVTERCYWKLEAHPHPDDLDTTVATVRRLLERSVARQVDTDPAPGVMLSGGLDSSAITALAASALSRRGERLRTYTVSFRRHEEHFRPDAVRATSDDSFVDEVSAHVGAEHSTVRLDTAELMDPVARDLTIRAKDLPAPLGDMNISLYVFCRAVRERTPVTLVGESADSLFGGNVWTHDPELAAGDTLPWVAMARRDGARFTLGSGLLRPELMEDLDVLGFARDVRRTVAAQTPLPPGADETEKRMRRLAYLHLTRFVEYQNAHCDAITANVGLRARLPFADHTLWEYVYNVPWSMQTFDGREKSLLRAAVADLLPDSVLNRRKSPFPITRDPGYDQGLVRALTELLDDPRSPVTPLIDAEAARAVLKDETAWTRRGWLTRTDIEMVLALDYWLRAYGLRVRL
jgi:asparagine synthase (glutamine-hydrolysing)